MTHNGPAIWGGCVTRREHRAESRYPAPAGPESCHGARRVWRTFCRHGTKFYEHNACRGTNLIEARKLSRYIEIKLRAMARVRVHLPLRICLGCRSKSKNRDKQLTFIVRVMGRNFYSFSFEFHLINSFT